jgi:hypothetical protein
MMWLESCSKEALSGNDWELVSGMATAIHDHLQKTDDPNWQDTYDRIFDRLMDRAKSGTLHKTNSFLFYLLHEDSVAKKPSTSEFQVSRNRWRNLKVQERFDIRSELTNAVIDGEYTLTPIEGFILLARYTMGMSFKAIGEMLGYDRFFISASLDAIAEKLILEMGERVEVHVAPEPAPIIRKEQKFDARYIPGGHRRAR